jgi:hypothetical protein
MKTKLEYGNVKQEKERYRLRQGKKLDLQKKAIWIRPPFCALLHNDEKSLC